MAKKSFIYFGLSILALFVMILIFAFLGNVVSSQFFEYAHFLIPFLFVPSIILSIKGVNFGKKARIDSKEVSSTFAYVCNIILLVLLIVSIVCDILFTLLVLSFAG